MGVRQQIVQLFSYIFERQPALMAAFIALIVYLVGISDVSAIDSWGYAADIANGEYLFRPHHLLYTISGYYWVRLLMGVFTKIELIFLLKLMNAIAASAAIYMLMKILLLLGVDTIKALLLSLFVSFSWGVIRFAIDNEAYIIPIALSVSASYFYIKAQKRDINRYYIISGLLAALACLYHQVMFFWWLALAAPIIRRLPERKALLFLLPSAIVPITYIAVMIYEGLEISLTSLLAYIFYDYEKGNASVNFNVNLFLLGGINLFRSFLQVHGYIVFLLKQSWIWLAPLVISVFSFSISSYLIGRSKIGFQNFSTYQRIHLAALFMQIIFAFLSEGNAEFMAMVPFLVAIVVSNLRLSKTALGFMVGGLIFWNISFGILPVKIYPDSTNMLVNRISQTANDKSAYILTEAPKVLNRLDYLSISKPMIMKKEKLQNESIIQIIDSLTVMGFTIYTDCINRPNPISRASLLTSGSIDTNLLTGYQLIPIDSIVALGGKYYLYQVTP